MKVNLKTTNEAENAAETPTCHQRGQRTVNGIIGNTRRGIVVDKTLDPDSNNPVANKAVSTALAALAGQLEKGQVVFLDQLPESGEPHKVYVLTATNQRYWWDGNAFVKIVPTDIKDSATIKHTLAENKISLDLDETIKGKIDAALQKPMGLTKTKLVGVGTSGQENIEIGENLTLANGKLSATGGGSGGLSYNILVGSIEGLDDKSFSGSYTGKLELSEINVLQLYDDLYILIGIINTANPISGNGMVDINGDWYSLYMHNNQFTLTKVPLDLYTHFITLTKDNESIYIQYSRMRAVTDYPFDMSSLVTALSGKKIICTGVLGNSDETKADPKYVSGEGGGLEVYYVLQNDTSGSISNKSITDYAISDSVSHGE